MEQKNKIINNPDQWIITHLGDFVRIKDSEISVEASLTKIREHLKKPCKGRFVSKVKLPNKLAKKDTIKFWRKLFWLQ